MGKAKISLFVIFSFGIFCSCQNTEDVRRGVAVLSLPSNPYTYDSSINRNDNIPTLGRVLFYDSRLSVNNSISCASCHKQARAFADNVPFSSGFEGKLTFRNSMPIQNLVVSFMRPLANDVQFNDTLSLFWDGREKLLKAMVLRPITNHVEMGITDLDALALKLSQISDYQNLFAKAYGSPEVTQMKIADALSQFLMNIKSTTRLDGNCDPCIFNPNIPSAGAPLSDEENAGWVLFSQKYNCNSCHQVTLPNGYQVGGGFINIGLDRMYKDIGLADVTGLSTDVGKFKIPTLHNVALTAPYMHDGRYPTLDDVLEHYSSGIQDHPNLDFRLKDGNNHPLKMNISSADRKAIIEFLNTLTDYNMITDPRFSNPFVTK